MCMNGAESLNHLFVHCSLASKVWSFTSSRLELSFCLPRRIDDFILEGFGGISLKGKVLSFGIVWLGLFFGSFGKNGIVGFLRINCPMWILFV